MHLSIRSLVAGLLLFLPLASAAAQTPKTVAATIMTKLKTGGEHIRQFAFDGNLDTYFTSAAPADGAEPFTLVFDRPVAVQRIAILTGRPDGSDKLNGAVLEVAENDSNFQLAAKFENGTVRTQLAGRQVKALRIRLSDPVKQTMTIREIEIDAEPRVAVFKYPVEFHLDVSDAPEMQAWAEKTARVCELQYAAINEELKSDGYKPPHLVRMALKSDYKGIAYASGGRIVGAVKYFKAHPDDIGAMVHETVHVVQSYRTRGNPSWLVEGIADYVRFFKYEPGKLGRLNPDKARYNGSYRTSAAFLAFLVENYDKDIVRKLNQAMREGEYREELFRVLTKKSVQQLDEEWRATLLPTAAGKQASAPGTTRIVLVAGSNFFKPGEHEYVAGCAVLRDMLKQTSGVEAELVLDWPKQAETFAGARAVVFFFDGGDKHALLQEDRLAQVQKLADAGVGLVHLHQVIDYPKDLAERARGWMGAAWEKDHGQRAHWVTEFKKFPDHPICRGVTPFQIDDGWLYKLRFVPGMKGVMPLLRTVSPKASSPEPGDDAIVSWAYERPGGGRAFTFTGGHLHKSLAAEGYRRFLVNGILWSAGLDIPAAGAPVRLDAAELDRGPRGAM
jgi:hypothetical protein